MGGGGGRTRNPPLKNSFLKLTGLHWENTLLNCDQSKVLIYKMGHSHHLFSYIFVISKLQFVEGCSMMSLMGFEQWTSGVGSTRFTNRATSTAPLSLYVLPLKERFQGGWVVLQLFSSQALMDVMVGKKWESGSFSFFSHSHQLCQDLDPVSLCHSHLLIDAEDYFSSQESHHQKKLR